MDQTREVLRQLNPLDLPCPDIDLDEEDDSLTFEWSFGRSYMGSLNIMPGGEIAWAVLAGESSSHGQGDLAQGLPDTFVEALRTCHILEFAARPRT